MSQTNRLVRRRWRCRQQTMIWPHHPMLMLTVWSDLCFRSYFFRNLRHQFFHLTDQAAAGDTDSMPAENHSHNDSNGNVVLGIMDTSVSSSPSPSPTPVLPQPAASNEASSPLAGNSQQSNSVASNGMLFAGFLLISRKIIALILMIFLE